MTASILGTRQGNAPVPLAILDFAMAGRGYTAREVLAGSIELAKLVDRRSFSRYWVAEHHSMPGVTTSSPPLLLARLVGETKRIRLGAGGMMLPNFPPLVVAEQFGLLGSLAPGRIDLGIGRAPGTDMTTAAALRRGQIGTEAFSAQLMELLAFLDADFPEGNPYGSRVNGCQALGKTVRTACRVPSIGHPSGCSAPRGIRHILLRIWAFLLPSPRTWRTKLSTGPLISTAVPSGHRRFSIIPMSWSVPA